MRSIRQKIRKFLLILSFILFPVMQYYFSPYLIIQGASENIVNGSFIIFFIFLFFGIFLGRSFCGWIQPCGGFQEIAFLFRDKKIKNNFGNYIKYIIWILWLLFLISIIIIAGGYKNINFFYGTDKGISISNIYAYIVYYGVIFIFLLLSLIFGRRASCHYICWMSPFMIIGRFIGNVLNVPSLRLKSYKDKCVSCKKCNDICPMSLDVNDMVSKNKMEHTECILCGECVDSCKNSAIKFYFGAIKKQ